MRSTLLGVALALTLSCQPSWTYVTALEPVRVHMDVDQDGAVSAVEYQAVSYRAPDFGTADSDGDGDLSHTEIWNIVLSQAPATFDGGMPMTEPSSMDMSAYFGTDYDERILIDMMNFLREEVAVLEPGADLPTRRQIARAARSKRLDAPQVVDVLRQLRARHQELGLRFPKKLGENLDAIGGERIEGDELEGQADGE